MNKAELMQFSSLLKFALGFFGIGLSLVLIAFGLARQDKTRFKRAAITFFSTCVALIALSILEFWILASMKP